MAGYERLSRSMSLDREYDFSDQDQHDKKQHKRGLGILSKVILPFKKISNPPEESPPKVAEKKEKKRSSWLPDPDKRWPIQGW